MFVLLFSFSDNVLREKEKLTRTRLIYVGIRFNSIPFLPGGQAIIETPFSMYSTFVVEQRHGFNKQTLSLFFTDKVRHAES